MKSSSSFATDCPALSSYIPQSPATRLPEATASMIFELMMLDGQSCQLRHGYNHRSLQEAEVSSSPVLNIAMVVVCLVSGAMASGITQGLLSLDLMETKITARSGTTFVVLFYSFIFTSSIRQSAYV